jgi:hypothetical protein
MPLYSAPYYGTDYYGLDIFGNPPGGIFGLNAYQNVDGTVVLYWRYEPCTTAFNSFTWTVQTDLVDTFDSVSLKTYSSVANPDYIVGGSNKGMIVPAYTRNQGVSTPMFWRVQGHYGSIDTAFSSSVYGIPKAIDDVVRQNMLDLIPEQIFKKDFAADNFQIQSIVFDGDLVTGNTVSLDIDGVPITPVLFSVSSQATLAVVATQIATSPGVGNSVAKSSKEIVVTSAAKDAPIRIDNISVTGGATIPQGKVILRNSTNLNNLYKSFGKELDSFSINLILTDADLFTQFVRDQSLVKNFSSLYELQRPATMQTIDFREIVRTIVREIGGTPSLGSLKRVLNAMFCEDPGFTLIRDTLEMYVNDPSSLPVVDPFWVDDPLSVPPVDPATVWNNHNLGFGVIITINNPLGLAIPASFVRQIVNMMKPVHAPVYLSGI